MRVHPTLRPALGASTGSAVIAVCSVASLIAYLFFSKAVRMMASDWTFMNFVLKSIVADPHFRAFSLGVSPTVTSGVTFVVFVASCVAAGYITASVFTGTRAFAPIALIAGLASSVVPTLVIATVRWPDGRGSITNVAICAAQLVFVALLWLWSRRVRASASTPNLPTPHAATPRWIRIATLVAACYAFAVLLNGLSGIFGYDSYSDHLAIPGRWLKVGSIEHGLPEEMISFYPGNFELLVRWTLSLGTDRLAFLLAYGSSVAAVWVVYRISLELAQSRTAAMLSALGAASLQVIAYQSIVVYSDSYTALCLLLATWMLIIWARDGARDNRLTFAFGIALGLALGAKYSAGPPAVIFGLIWLWLSWRSCSAYDDELMESHFDTRAFAKSSVAFAVGVLPCMAYWYVRNAIEQHNPLFPLSVAGLPGMNIGALLANAPGPKTTLERLTWPWTEVGHIAGFETGLGPVFASIAVLAVLAAPFGARLRAGSPARLTWILLIGVFIAWSRTGVLVPRYGFFPLLLSFVFIGELWMAFASQTLGVVFGVAMFATMFGVGHEMLGSAAYNALFFDPAPRVPAIVNEIPAARILNAAGQPSGYYARGTDMRHRVINLFKGVTPDDVRRLAPDYLLLPQDREVEFVGPLTLELMGRWEKKGQPPTALWRVPPQSAATNSPVQAKYP